MKSLSVVIPAYNEEENIENAIVDVYKAFPLAEVIVVNDASTDNTLQILKALTLNGLKVLTNEKNMGHGYSVVKGLKAAKGRFILYIDADRQISLLPFLGFETTFYDIISGYRVNRQDKLFRKIISFCLKTTNLLRHGYYIKDANCPFKMYKRSTLRPLLKILPPSNIIPIACLEVLARKNNLKTRTIPTLHHKYPKERKGFLQSINAKSLLFFWDAFKEVVKL